MVVGDRWTSGTDDNIGMIGWRRTLEGTWQRVRGRDAPAIEYLSTVVHAGREWVLVGQDARPPPAATGTAPSGPRATD